MKAVRCVTRHGEAKPRETDDGQWAIRRSLVTLAKALSEWQGRNQIVMGGE